MIQLIGKRSLIAVGTVYWKQLVLIKGLNQVAWIADLTMEVAWLWVLIKLRASGLASSQFAFFCLKLFLMNELRHLPGARNTCVVRLRVSNAHRREPILETLSLKFILRTSCMLHQKNRSRLWIIYHTLVKSVLVFIIILWAFSSFYTIRL